MILFSLLDGTDEISDIYWKAELKCRKYIKIIAGFIVMNQVMYTWPFLRSIFDVCTGNIDPSKWNLAFGVVMPFDMTTLWGWYLAWFIESNFAFAYSTAMVATTSYFVALCIYIGAVCKHFIYYVQLNEIYAQNLQKEKDANEQMKLTQRITETLTRSIEIHIKSYE